MVRPLPGQRHSETSWGNRAVNLPNALTLLRIILVPLLIALLVRENFGIALWVFVVAGVSDLLDGFIAKRFDLCTRLGAILDPLADKLLIVASFLVLAAGGRLPWWLAAVVILRDLVIVGGACAYHFRAGEVEMAPSPLSKANTFVQLCLILLVLLQGAGVVRTVNWLPLVQGVVLFTTIVSGVHYVVVWTLRARALGDQCRVRR